MLNPWKRSRNPKSATQAVRLLPEWRKVAVPAIGAPYSERAVKAACKLVDSLPNADVHLVYVMEVPRALAMATPLPGDEALAEQFLSEGRSQAMSCDVAVMTDVIRGREAVETLIRYLKQNEFDLVVLGSRADEVRGLPISVVRQIFSRAPCAVLLDHIGAESAPTPPTPPT